MATSTMLVGVFAFLFVASIVLRTTRRDLRHAAIFEPLAIPSSLEPRGITGQGLAQAVRARLSATASAALFESNAPLNIIQSGAPVSRATPSVSFPDEPSASSASAPAVSAYGVSWDLNSVERWTLGMLRSYHIGPSRITGSLEVTGDEVSVRLFVDGEGVAPARGKLTDLAYLMRKAADGALPLLPLIRQRAEKLVDCETLAQNLNFFGFGPTSYAFLSAATASSDFCIPPREWLDELWSDLRSLPQPLSRPLAQERTQVLALPLAEAAEDMGKLDEAVALVGVASKAAGLEKDPDRRRRLLDVWLSLEQSDKVLENLRGQDESRQAVLDRDFGVQKVRAYNLLGRDTEVARDLELLATYWSRAQKEEPESRVAWLVRLAWLDTWQGFRAYVLEGNSDEGNRRFEEAARRAKELDNVDVQAQVLVAWAAAEGKANLRSEAVDHYRRASRLVPNDPSVLVALADALDANDWVDEALAVCASAVALVDQKREAASWSDLEQRWRALARLCAHAPGQTDGACQRLKTESPRGRLLFSQLEVFDGPAEHLRAIESVISEKDLSQRDRLELQFARADLLWNAGNEGLAFAALASAASRQPWAIDEIVTRRVAWLTDLGRYAKAREAARDAKHLTPVRRLLLLSDIAYAEGRFVDSVWYARTASESRPRSVEATRALVRALAGSGGEGEAATLAEAIRAQNPWLAADLLGAIVLKAPPKDPRKVGAAFAPWVDLGEAPANRDLDATGAAAALEGTMTADAFIPAHHTGMSGPHVPTNDDWAKVARLYWVARRPDDAIRILGRVRGDWSEYARTARAQSILLRSRESHDLSGMSDALRELGAIAHEGPTNAKPFVRLALAWDQAQQHATAKLCFATAAGLDEGQLGKLAAAAAARLADQNHRSPNAFGAPQDGYCTLFAPNQGTDKRPPPVSSTQPT